MTRDERKERGTRESRRRSRRKIAVADDMGRGKDVKNGSVPNECHPSERRLKTRKGTQRRARHTGKVNEKKVEREFHARVDVSYV